VASVRANHQVAQKMSEQGEQERSFLLSCSAKALVVESQSALSTLQIFR
jgi:hypothetical protein